MGKNELRQTLLKLGFDKVDEDILEAIFYIFDPNRNETISYIKLCLKFYEYANQKAIID